MTGQRNPKPKHEALLNHNCECLPKFPNVVVEVQAQAGVYEHRDSRVQYHKAQDLFANVCILMHLAQTPQHAHAIN